MAIPRFVASINVGENFEMTLFRGCTIARKQRGPTQAARKALLQLISIVTNSLWQNYTALIFDVLQFAINLRERQHVDVDLVGGRTACYSR